MSVFYVEHRTRYSKYQMKSTQEHFVSNLKRLRKTKYRSQWDFAEHVGLSERGYQDYEQGVAKPTPDILDRFAAALGVDVVDLVRPPDAPPAKVDNPDELERMKRIAKYALEAVETLEERRKFEAELTTEEIELLKFFRAVDVDRRNGILGFAKRAFKAMQKGRTLTKKRA